MSTEPSTPGSQAQSAHRHLGKPALRLALRILALSLFLVAVWLAGSRILQGLPGEATAPVETPTSAPTPGIDLASFPLPDLRVRPAVTGITRLAQLHTILPARPRFDITRYTVQKGDTIFGIAERFGLKPQSVMWGNYETLGDDPDMIQPGLELVILPVDGAYHKWREGEGLNKVSEYYHVTPEEIINWPGNHLSLETVGDFSKPNIAPGTMLIVPGGRREYISKVPTVPRKNPGSGSNLGPGSCSAVSEGAVGTSTWVRPVGGVVSNPFSPETNHPAVDLAAPLGTGIAAADTGVVVYAGPTYARIGYGNLVIIDHGNGWQTLYAHLGPVYVSCGQGVFQGAIIGAIGMTGNTTGPHLHFEMRSDTYGKVNPLNFIP